MDLNESLRQAKVGDFILFAEEIRGYKIMARGVRYLVCNKPFACQRTVLYTVIDLLEQVRGTENLIFGRGAETTEQCEEMLARLEGRCKDIGFTTVVSSRNRIPLHVIGLRAPGAKYIKPAKPAAAAWPDGT